MVIAYHCPKRHKKAHWFKPMCFKQSIIFFRKILIGPVFEKPSRSGNEFISTQIFFRRQIVRSSGIGRNRRHFRQITAGRTTFFGINLSNYFLRSVFEPLAHFNLFLLCHFFCTPLPIYRLYHLFAISQTFFREKRRGMIELLSVIKLFAEKYLPQRR